MYYFNRLLLKEKYLSNSFIGKKVKNVVVLYSALGRKRLPSQGGTDSDDSQSGVQVTPNKQPTPRGPPPPPAPDRPSTTPSTGSNVPSTSGGSLGPVVPPSSDPMSATAVRTPILAPVNYNFLVCY